TSMDMIAVEAGVSKQTLYARYQKETLLQAVVEDRLAAWMHEFKGDPGIGNTLETRLRHRIEAMMIVASSDDLRAFARLMAAALPQISQTYWKLCYQTGIDIISRDIEEFSAAEGQPAREPRRVATELVAMLAGWFRMEFLTHGVTALDAVAF